MGREQEESCQFSRPFHNHLIINDFQHPISHTGTSTHCVLGIDCRHVDKKCRLMPVTHERMGAAGFGLTPNITCCCSPLSRHGSRQGNQGSRSHLRNPIRNLLTIDLLGIQSSKPCPNPAERDEILIGNDPTFGTLLNPRCSRIRGLLLLSVSFCSSLFSL